jgi:hypothetical protein
MLRPYGLFTGYVGFDRSSWGYVNRWRGVGKAAATPSGSARALRLDTGGGVTSLRNHRLMAPIPPG